MIGEIGCHGHGPRNVLIPSTFGVKSCRPPLLATAAPLILCISAMMMCIVRGSSGIVKGHISDISCVKDEEYLVCQGIILSPVTGGRERNGHTGRA